jgi:hypothetical protein
MLFLCFVLSSLFSSAAAASSLSVRHCRRSGASGVITKRHKMVGIGLEFVCGMPNFFLGPTLACFTLGHVGETPAHSGLQRHLPPCWQMAAITCSHLISPGSLLTRGCTRVAFQPLWSAPISPGLYGKALIALASLVTDSA